MSVNFNKKLGDKNLKDLYGMLAKNVTSIDGRLRVADTICECDFFKIYFDDIYNPHLNKGDELAFDNNVCTFLERLADYILLSDEEKKDRSKDSECFYYTRRDRLLDKMNKELNFSDILTTNPDLNNIILHQLSNIGDCGEILLKDVEVTKSDLSRNDELGEILRSYKEAIVRVDKDHRLNNREKQNQKYLLAEDMKTAKKYYFGISDNIYKNQQSNNYTPDQQDLSMAKLRFNREVLDGVSVKLDYDRSRKFDGLLFMDSEGLDENDPLSFWIYSLEEVIKETPLTQREHQVLRELRKGISQTELAKSMGVTQQYISKVYNSALNKIIKQQEECKNG